MALARYAFVIGMLAAALQAQSLWDATRHAAPMHADTTARHVGDIVTIIIDESQVVENDEETKLEKESSLSAILSNFQILPRMFDPLPEVEGNQSRSFDGKAEYGKDNKFKTRISVLVVDVMPNGNLIVEGTRRLVVDGETKVVRLTGTIRPYDVTRANTVMSQNVANAAISYEGTGFLTRTTNRGWFSRLLDVFWPF